MHVRLSLCRQLASVALAAFLLAAPAARAQLVPVTGPYLTYSVTNLGNSQVVTLTLNGFTNDPAGLTPGTPAYADHSIWSYYEKTFEQAGGVVTSGADVTADNAAWTFHTDVGFSTPVRPVVPQDPRIFQLVTVPPDSGTRLYNQIFYFYNYDNESGNLYLDEAPPALGTIVNGQLTDPTRNRGPIAFGRPCPDGEVCGGTIRQPAANAPVVPEPGAFLTLGVGMTLGLGALARRRRRV